MDNFTTGRTFAHTQHYNDLGLVREVGYPFRTDAAETPRAVAYSYRNGLLTGVDGWATISYQPNGTIATVAHNGDVTETWTPDPNGMPRPRAITVSRGATQLWTSGNYSFDGAGNIQEIGTRRYRYDAQGRLTAWRDGSPETAHRMESFRYDAFGNRLEATVTGCDGRFRCYTSSALLRAVSGTTNRYTDATYDAAGNVLTDAGRTFTYDSVNMPMTVVAGQRTFIYLYTAADERVTAVERLANGTNKVTWTLRGFGNQLLTVRDGDTWKEDQIWRGSSLAGFLTPGNVKRHHSLDHLGSPRVITDDSGNLIGTQTFTPFGDGGSLDSGALQFTGHERDKAMLGGGTVELPDYAHARLLDTRAGRFLSVDPVNSATPSAPQSWNRYAYARNNPMALVDRNGKWPSAVVHTHQNAIDFTLRTLPERDRQILKQAQVTADFDQQNQYKHAMRNPGQSPRDAAILANKFIDAAMNRTIALEKAGNHAGALLNVGLAMHTLQDNTSPMHMGLQEFDPNAGNLSGATLGHVQGELFDPSGRPQSSGLGENLDRATYDAYAYFARATGLPVPPVPQCDGKPCFEPSGSIHIEVPPK